MTTYYCISTNVGNPWNSGSWWSLTDGGASAGAYPVAGDTVYVKTGKAIGVPFVAHCYRLHVQGGTVLLRYGYSIVYDDAAGAGLYIDDTNSGGFYTDATVSSLAYMSSASVVPAHPWTISVEYIDGADARTLGFDYVRMDGMAWTLGIDDTTRIVFNLSGGTAWLNNVPPLMRDQVITEHQIDGRAYSRIYPRGGKAGVITISGLVDISSYYYAYLQEMLDGQHRLYLFSRYVQLPRCRVSGKPSMSTTPGQMMVKFSIPLIEDG